MGIMEKFKAGRDKARIDMAKRRARGDIERERKYGKTAEKAGRIYEKAESGTRGIRKKIGPLVIKGAKEGIKYARSSNVMGTRRSRRPQSGRRRRRRKRRQKPSGPMSGGFPGAKGFKGFR